MAYGEYVVNGQEGDQPEIEISRAHDARMWLPQSELITAAHLDLGHIQKAGGAANERASREAELRDGLYTPFIQRASAILHQLHRTIFLNVFHLSLFKFCHQGKPPAFVAFQDAGDFRRDLEAKYGQAVGIEV